MSDELTKTKAALIGTITITTARNTLLKNALNEGVIDETFYLNLSFQIIIA